MRLLLWLHELLYLGEKRQRNRTTPVADQKLVRLPQGLDAVIQLHRAFRGRAQNYRYLRQETLEGCQHRKAGTSTPQSGTEEGWGTSVQSKPVDDQNGGTGCGMSLSKHSSDICTNAGTYTVPMVYSNAKNRERVKMSICKLLQSSQAPKPTASHLLPGSLPPLVAQEARHVRVHPRQRLALLPAAHLRQALVHGLPENPALQQALHVLVDDRGLPVRHGGLGEDSDQVVHLTRKVVFTVKGEVRSVLASFE